MGRFEKSDSSQTAPEISYDRPSSFNPFKETREQKTASDMLPDKHPYKKARLEKEAREDTLRSHEKSLSDLNDTLDKMKQDKLYATDSDFQVAVRDTQRDLARTQVMLDDLQVSPKQRAEDKERWKTQLRADQLVSNDKNSEGSWAVDNFLATTYAVSTVFLPNTISWALGGPTAGGLDNKLKHIKGAKLQRMYGSAEKTNLHEQEFRERDWDKSKIKTWSAEVAARADFIKALKTQKQAETTIPGQERSSDTEAHNESISKTKQEYVSRYPAFERPERLPLPGMVDASSRTAVREALLDVKQQLREVHGDREDQSKAEYVRELYNRLPLREIEKWRHLLERENSYRNQENPGRAQESSYQEKKDFYREKLYPYEKNLYSDTPATRKENRTTTFEDMDDKHFLELYWGAKDQTIIVEETAKFKSFLKDISGERNSLALHIKSNDVLRSMAFKSPKNWDLSRALNKTPPELRGSMFQRLHEQGNYQLWQQLSKSEAVDIVNQLSKREVKSLLTTSNRRRLADFKPGSTANNNNNETLLPRQRNTQFSNFEAIVAQSEHKDLLPDLDEES